MVSSYIASKISSWRFFLLLLLVASSLRNDRPSSLFYAQSLPLSPSSTSSSSINANTPPSNRIFVAGLSPTCNEQTLRSKFAEFGTVQDVVLIGTPGPLAKNNRQPYCFVTFDDVSSAQRAVASSSTIPTADSDDASSDSIYKEIKYALPKDENKRTRSNASKAKEAERLQQMEAWSRETNLIVQVQSTHLHRLVSYLQRTQQQQPAIRHGDSIEERGGTDGNSSAATPSCKVLGSTRSHSSKNISVLYLRCNPSISWARRLYAEPPLARAINKLYVVQPGLLLEGDLATERGCKDFAKILCNEVSLSLEEERAEAVLRMQVFPPKHQSRLLQSLDQMRHQEKTQQQPMAISPRGFTHLLSVVEVYRFKGRGSQKRRQQQKENHHHLYMIGVSPATSKLDVVDTNNIISDNDNEEDVNRAYYKLKEAIETYEDTSYGPLPDLVGSIALDCGAAPGGWTKYLIERFRCETVCSIDPGHLSPSVASMPQTHHMPMKVQEALPLLRGNNDVQGNIQLWVSDMCLHDMEEQATLLLQAKEDGILASRTFFVLTLKCIVGHSKQSHDDQVARVVEKLQLQSSRGVANVEQLKTFHLFSNRSGERTVMGWICSM